MVELCRAGLVNLSWADQWSTPWNLICILCGLLTSALSDCLNTFHSLSLYRIIWRALLLGIWQLLFLECSTEILAGNWQGHVSIWVRLRNREQGIWFNISCFWYFLFWLENLSGSILSVFWEIIPARDVNPPPTLGNTVTFNCLGLQWSGIWERTDHIHDGKLLSGTEGGGRFGCVDRGLYYSIWLTVSL